MSTLPVRDATLGKSLPEQGKLFVFDTTRGKFVRKIEPLRNSPGTGFIVGVGEDRVLGLMSAEDDRASVIYGVHVASGKLAFIKRIPFPLDVKLGSNQRELWDYRLGPDGHVWTYIKGVLVRIDPQDAEVRIVGRPDQGGRLAFSNGEIYLAGREQLRRIKMPAAVDAATSRTRTALQAGD